VELCGLEIGDRLIALAEAHLDTFTSALTITVLGELHLLRKAGHCDLEDVHVILERLRPHVAKVNRRSVSSFEPIGGDTSANERMLAAVPPENVPPEQVLFSEFAQLMTRLSSRHQRLVIVAAFAEVLRLLLKQLAARDADLADSMWQAIHDAAFSQVELNG
jgi:hypothetical protein